jgi:zinc protease
MSGKMALLILILVLTEGVKAKSTPKDLEYLFQTVYAYFTDLNLDQQALMALSKNNQLL